MKKKVKSFVVNEDTWVKVMEYKFENRHIFGSVDELIAFMVKNVKKIIPNKKSEMNQNENKSK